MNTFAGEMKWISHGLALSLRGYCVRLQSAEAPSACNCFCGGGSKHGGSNHGGSKHGGSKHGGSKCR